MTTRYEIWSKRQGESACNHCLHGECEENCYRCKNQDVFVTEYLERMKSQAGKWTPMGRRDEFGGLQNER